MGSTTVNEMILKFGADTSKLKTGVNDVKKQLMGINTIAKMLGVATVGLFAKNAFSNFIDSATIQLLEKGDKRMQTLIKREKEHIILQKKDLEAVLKLKEGYINFQKTVQILSIKLLNNFLPAIQKISDGMNKAVKWIQENERYVSAAIIAVSAVMLKRLIPSIKACGKALWGLLKNPVVAGLAAIGVAIFLLAEDFLAFKEGADHLVNWDAVIGGLNKILEAAKSLGGWLKDNFVPILAIVSGALASFVTLKAVQMVELLKLQLHLMAMEGKTIQSVLWWSIRGLKLAILDAGKAILVATKAAWGFATSPVGMLIIVVGALVTIIILLIKNWDKVKEAFLNGINIIKEAFSNFINWYIGLWKNAFNFIINAFKNLINMITNFDWNNLLPDFLKNVIKVDGKITPPPDPNDSKSGKVAASNSNTNNNVTNNKTSSVNINKVEIKADKVDGNNVASTLSNGVKNEDLVGMADRN